MTPYVYINIDQRMQMLLSLLGIIFIILGVVALSFAFTWIFFRGLEIWIIIRGTIICIGLVLLWLSTKAIYHSEEEKLYQNFLFQLGILIVIYGLLFSIFYTGYFGFLIPWLMLLVIGIIFMMAMNPTMNFGAKKEYIFRNLIFIMIIQTILSIVSRTIISYI